MTRSRDRSLSRERRRDRSRERRHSSRSPGARRDRAGRGDDRARSPRDDRDRHRHGGHRERRRSRSRDDAERSRHYDDRRSFACLDHALHEACKSGVLPAAGFGTQRSCASHRPHGRDGQQESYSNGRGHGDAYQRGGGFARPAEVGIPDIGSIHRSACCRHG